MSRCCSITAVTLLLRDARALYVPSFVAMRYWMDDHSVVSYLCMVFVLSIGTKNSEFVIGWLHHH
jgi:hypothetical protein